MPFVFGILIFILIALRKFAGNQLKRPSELSKFLKSYISPMIPLRIKDGLNGKIESWFYKMPWDYYELSSRLYFVNSKIKQLKSIKDGKTVFYDEQGK